MSHWDNCPNGTKPLNHIKLYYCTVVSLPKKTPSDLSPTSQPPARTGKKTFCDIAIMRPDNMHTPRPAIVRREHVVIMVQTKALLPKNITSSNYREKSVKKLFCHMAIVNSERKNTIWSFTMKAPYPILKPAVKVFEPNILQQIKNPAVYSNAVPNVMINSPAAKSLSKLFASADPFITTYVGMDGLPVILKDGQKYWVVSGQLTLAAAKLMQYPVACNVYQYKKFKPLLERLAFTAAFVKPFAISLYAAAHQSAPHTQSGQLSDRWMPYHHAAAIDAYNMSGTPISRVMPEIFTNSWRMLELFGVGSKSDLQRKNVPLGFEKHHSSKHSGQPVYPEFIHS